MRKPVISTTFAAAAAAAVVITATSCLPRPALSPTPANAGKAPGWHIVCHGGRQPIVCHWVRNPK